MFVSFTDWEFDGKVDNAVEAAKGFWPEMKKYGAVNMRATVTGEKTLRTMTVWSDQKKLEANIDEIRAAAGSAVGMTVTGGMTVLLRLSLIDQTGSSKCTQTRVRARRISFLGSWGS